MVKVLTIKEPFASLIANNIKRYEFRSWKTNYRDKLYIHAGKSTDKEAIKKFKEYHLSYKNGYILCVVELIDCILITNDNIESIKNENRLVYNNIKVGEYAWQIKLIKKIDSNRLIKGKLSIWNLDEII